MGMKGKFGSCLMRLALFIMRVFLIKIVDESFDYFIIFLMIIVVVMDFI
jgi:hypothetical protein